MRLLILLVFLASAIGINAQSTRALQLFEIGINASEKGDHATALQEFSNTLKTNEREGASDRFFAKVHYNLGVSNYQLLRFEQAVVEYKKAETYANGSYERASYALGLAHSELKNWKEAEKAFRRAIIQNSRNGEAWFDLAFVYVATGENDKAVRAFQKAVKFGAAEIAVSHNNLGVLMALNGDVKNAEIELRKAVEVSGGSLEAANSNLATFSKNGQVTLESLAFARRQPTMEKS